jgi:prolyl oligopeptidase PreP (S9A serine peptidase family)
MFMAYNSTFCWVNKSGVLDLISYSNPYNDKEVVLTGGMHSSNEYMSCLIDLVTGKSISTELDLPLGSDIKSTIINGAKKRIGYLANGNIFICNYITMKNKSSISTEFDWNNSNIKVCFSKDGSLVYIFNKDDLRLVVYDAVTGAKKDELIIDSNPKLYSAGYLNGDKEEFAIVKNDSMEFWSISTKSIIRKIPFYSNAENVEFRNNGDNITLVINNNNFGSTSYRVGSQFLTSRLQNKSS